MQRQWILALLMTLFSMPLGARIECRSERSTDGFDVERAAAAKELLAGLDAYVEWCSAKKLWVERNRVLEAILVIDPSNMSAKRGLGWQQVADGVWEPPKDPKPAKNYDPGALKEAPARYAEAIRPWHEHLVRLLGEHRGELTSVQCDAVYTQMLAVDPDDPLVHTARGEERTEKGWVMVETVRAKARRTEIKAIVKEALDAVPEVHDIDPSTDDLAFKVPWKGSVGTDRVRVFSTTDRTEAARAAKVLHATRDVFNRVFGTPGKVAPVFSVYLLGEPEFKQTFVENMGKLSAAEQSFYARAEGTGFYGSDNMVWWSKSPEQRLDGVTRQAFGTMFRAEFNLTVDIAWAWEGLGLYLTREMIGTRLTWYYVLGEEGRSAAPKKGGIDWAKRIHTPGTNWMNEGYRLVRAGDAGSLTVTLQRPLNLMLPQDIFVSYVVAAHLLETEAERLPALLRQLGGSVNKPGAKPAEAWQNALTMDLETFVGRLERWLGERR